MMKCLLIVLLFYPIAIIAQESNTFKLSAKAARTTRFASGWIALDSGWKFKAGDDPDWAKPGFEDAPWESINLFHDLYRALQIPKNEIVWFRLRFSTDSTLLNRQLVMRIYQTGASEVYLDGKLIHRLGIVSPNPGSIKYYSPNLMLLSFPIKYNTEQVLAIRYANLPNQYPIFLNSLESNLEPWVTTLENAHDDNIVRYYRAFNNRLNIGIGVAAILCFLYLSFFIFFPTQKINLYFSLCNFFFVLFLVINSISLNYHGPLFKINMAGVAFVAIYLLLMLYCTYKMFNQRPAWPFWLLLATGALGVPATFLINSGLISTGLGVLVLIDVSRICIRALQNNQPGAWIILSFVAIDLVYWIINLLSGMAIINIPNIDSYVPFAFLIGPLSLAIYLGYAFGMTSQSLGQKLTEVEQLSNEKQQILSAQNETLEQQVKERTSELNQSLENLQSTQQQLIQSEKMASLGELTAGIAHEIQNPLNFVNNFSEVNMELIGEMQEQWAAGNGQQAREIAKNIRENEEKINHHGKNADAIVKSMLQHSRSSSGKKEPTDINALADEYFKLAYHGFRAKDKSFNAIPIAIGIKTTFDNTIGKINVVPQEIGRVMLNLANNAFYAVTERTKLNEAGYEPTVSLSTRKLGKKIEIKIKDNGTGIPEKISGKIFQPFFTTKPAGQGTGLGLSLAYDIVKAHGGELKVKTTEREGAEFVILLPAQINER